MFFFLQLQKTTVQVVCDTWWGWWGTMDVLLMPSDNPLDLVECCLLKLRWVERNFLRKAMKANLENFVSIIFAYFILLIFHWKIHESLRKNYKHFLWFRKNFYFWYFKAQWKNVDNIEINLNYLRDSSQLCPWREWWKKNVERIFCAGWEQTKAGKQQVFHVQNYAVLRICSGKFISVSVERKKRVYFGYWSGFT